MPCPHVAANAHETDLTWLDNLLLSEATKADVYLEWGGYNSCECT